MVLEFRDDGIYCPAGDFYIDPWKPVSRAVITHGHADHARPGHGSYLATEAAAPVMRFRLGEISLQTARFGAQTQIGDATVSFHPAGHVPGSAQIRVAVRGEVWVVSGDYKLEPDPISEPFEPVRCHAFISECTFGLPVFTWDNPNIVTEQINDWWQANRAAGRFSVLGAYALGKAQRILSSVDHTIGPILTHGAIENTNEILRAQGLSLPQTTRVTPDINPKHYPGALVLATPSAMGGGWMKRFRPAPSTAFASGWMGVRGIRRRRAADRGFILSDHADWNGLNKAVRDTGAERIFVTHGYTQIFAKWLSEQGYEARIVETEFEGETLETPQLDDPA